MTQEKYYFENPKSSIKLLTEDEIEGAITDYKNGVKISEICQKYPKVKVSSFYKQLPYKLNQEKCEYCNNQIYTKIRKNGHGNDLAKLCIYCNHDYTKNCNCEQCFHNTNLALEEKKKELQIVWKNFYNEYYKLNYTLNDISIFDEIYLVLLIQSYKGIFENTLEFSSFKQFKFQAHASPHEYYPVISNLIDRKILIPNIYYFDSYDYIYSSEPSLPTINSTKVNWIPNIIKIPGVLLSVSELDKILKERTYSIENKKNLWKEVYWSEIKSYINFQSNKYLMMVIDNQTIEQVVDGLQPTFPISKAYNLVYIAISASMRYMQNYSKNERKVNSFFRNKMNELILKYQDHKNLKDYNRLLHIELSYFNQYVLKNILKQENAYFYLSTNKILDNADNKLV